jgi:Fe-S oxidoreductase
MAFDLTSPDFWNREALDRELRRVFDICHGCRRCFNLCPSFNVLFELIDAKGEDVENLTRADIARIVDLCYQCKLCFNHCPYTPPHRWDIDFPRLMLRAKAVAARERGIPRQDRILGRTEMLGRWGSRWAPLVNLANRLRPIRVLMERVIGVHRDRALPPYHRRTFLDWFRAHERRRAVAPSATGKVALFYTCYVNHHDPAVGRAAVRVLEHNGLEVVVPSQRCCGMPFLDGGDVESALAHARENVRVLGAVVEQGYDVVIPGPTCSYMLKHEYPVLLGDEAARRLAARSFDLCEYLMKLHGEGRLKTDLRPTAQRIAYQLPCHLRAQNIGYKSRDLMQLIPGTTVRVIERCAGIDGTWGLKREYYALSLKVAEKLFREVEQERPDLVVSDCPLAALQIAQGVGTRPVHPIQVLARAYGLEDDGGRP